MSAASEALPMPRLPMINDEVLHVLKNRGTDEFPITAETRGATAAALILDGVLEACEMWGVPA